MIVDYVKRPKPSKAKIKLGEVLAAAAMCVALLAVTVALLVW